jgi:hypothetical protein
MITFACMPQREPASGEARTAARLGAVARPLSAGGSTVNGGCLDLAVRTDQTSDYLFAYAAHLLRQLVIETLMRAAR